MLDKLRGFSNTKLAGVLIAIIIVPFVFWGMGSVFSGGNVNNVAKINNKAISTKNFIDHIKETRLNVDVIKNNLDNKILEEILSDIVSNKLLEMEIEDIDIKLSEKNLVLSIKNNQIFLDDKNNFSRIKYEKFLLENSLTAPTFENRLKNQELKKKLFDYIGGGIKSPHFLKNNIFINETKEIEIDYFDLDLAYNTNLTNSEIDEFIIENEESLKEDYIDLLYAKITPKDLVEINEFNDVFFKKIDEIENSILNGTNINNIEKNYNLKLTPINNYKYNEENEKNEVLKEIYSMRNLDEIQLIDKNDYFLLFKILKVNKILREKTDPKFLKKVKNNLILKKKYEYNKDLFEKIQDKKFQNKDFIKITQNKNNIKNIRIKSYEDDDYFNKQSINLIYSLPKESFVLITDKNNKVYLAKIKNIFFKNLSKDQEIVKDYRDKSNIKILSEIYSSYDLFLNEKYNVKIFEQTLNRVKDYFR